jgi:TolB-like protein
VRTRTWRKGNLYLGSLLVDLSTGEVRKPSGRVSKLPPQPCRVLSLLIDRRGQMLSRTEIREQLWGSVTFVDFEKAINFCIRQIRKTLGDSGSSPRYIETLRRRGFRLVAPVRGVGPVSQPGCVSVSPSRLAVLPFGNCSGDPQNDYLASGITDLLATELGHIGGLRVLSGTTVMRYGGTAQPVTEIAAGLGTTFVVEGSVLRLGNKTRIDVRLVDGQTEEQIWAQGYDGDSRGISLLQKQAALAVLKNVRARPTQPEDICFKHPGTKAADAREAYLQGRFFCSKWTEQDLTRSARCFRRAIERDPSYAPAFAGLAHTQTMLACFGVQPPEPSCRLAKAAATKALNLDDRLAEAHAVLGWLSVVHDWDWPEADRRLRRALELSDTDIAANFYYAFYLAIGGAYKGALATMQVARAVDPLSPWINTDLGWLYLSSRQHDRAMEQLERTRELDPRFAVVHFWLGNAYVRAGSYGGGIQELRRGVSLSRSSPQMNAGLAYAYALAGNEQKARAILRTLHELSTRRYVAPCELASVHLALGEREQALALLEKARAQRDCWLALLTLDPRFDCLWSDGNFINLLGKQLTPHHRVSRSGVLLTPS